MQPKTVSMGKRYILGFYGDRETDDIDGGFARRFEQSPFPHPHEYRSYIYLWDNPLTGESPEQGKNCMVGFEVERPIESDLFTLFEIPACEWIVFDEVDMAKWGDEVDIAIDWPSKNGMLLQKHKGAVYHLEYYKNKFTDGKEIMEVWYPLADNAAKKS